MYKLKLFLRVYVNEICMQMIAHNVKIGTKQKSNRYR